MEENKKIKNAKKTVVDGIEFKSTLEGSVYKYLKSVEIVPNYEPNAVVIWNRDKFSVPYYDRRGKVFRKITSKPIKVTYTPDFTFWYKGYKVVLEVKGYKNDVANYKIRLFRDALEIAQITSPEPYVYAVVYSLKDVKTLLEDLDKTM